MTAPVPERVLNPDGPGAELLSGPAAFYLTYQTQIDSWASLKGAARDRLAQWHRQEVGGAVSIDGWVRAEPCDFVMFGPEGLPHDLTIGLKWDGDPTVPYVTVEATSKELGGRFKRAVSDEHTEGYRSTSNTFPAWRYIRRDEWPTPWWAHLDLVRDSLVEEVEGAIARFGPVVIDVLAERSRDGSIPG